MLAVLFSFEKLTCHAWEYMLFYLSSPYLLPTSTLVTHVCSMQLINVAQASLSQVKNTLASLPMHFTRFH